MVQKKLASWNLLAFLVIRHLNYPPNYAMSLKINQAAPDFTLPSTSGQSITLSKDLKDTVCILYFYPKDFTGGCTAEACGFRDNMEEFNNVDLTILGISRDNISSHLKFKRAYGLPFELLSDLDGEVCKAYEALIPLFRTPKRITYLLGRDHTVKAFHQGTFGAEKHIQKMISSIKTQL